MFRLQLVFLMIYAASTYAVPSQLRWRRQTTDEATRLEFLKNNENGRCNNADLEKIMQSSISDDVKQSKLKIMEEAEKLLGGTFNVVCANGDFSYITSTRTYCLTGNESVKCYAFLADSSKINSEHRST